MIFKLAYLFTFGAAVAKLLEIAPVVNWSWWLVFAPALTSFTLGILIIVGCIYAATR